MLKSRDLAVDAIGSNIAHGYLPNFLEAIISHRPNRVMPKADGYRSDSWNEK